MSLKIIVFIGLLVSSIFSCKQREDPYQSTYSDQWKSVEKHIYNSWYKSKADSTTWQMPGSLKLPYAHYSAWENRNVIYGWDSYFSNAGLLLVDSLQIYAKNAINNHFSEIEQIGFIPNSSEPWGQNRSQTPFLSMMVKEVYEQTDLADKAWLKKAYHTLLIEYQFWTDTTENAIEKHQSNIKGLQRFSNHANEADLLDQFSHMVERFGYSNSIPKSEKLKISDIAKSEAESGMDFTPRFEHRCPDFIALDLNANLYLYEKNFAWMVKELELDNQPNWASIAAKRSSLIQQYCWDEDRGLFMDYDYKNNRFSKVASVASFYPLWVGIASEKQAKRTMANLPLFEMAYGISTCERTDEAYLYQWGYPSAWPPMYYIVAKGLDNYGYKKDAKRISSKYLDVVTKNFLAPIPLTYTKKMDGKDSLLRRSPGFIYEKYNANNGTINDAEYPSRELYDWSYGIYIWSIHYVRNH